MNKQTNKQYKLHITPYLVGDKNIYKLFEPIASGDVSLVICSQDMHSANTVISGTMSAVRGIMYFS